MCYDISFSTSIRTLSDYFPDLSINPQLDMEFTADHVQAQAYLPYPVIVDDNGLQLRSFEWGVIADYMKTADAVKKNRPLMCNAQGEKIIGDARSYWRKIRKNRCLIPVSGIFEHRAVKTFKNKIPYHITLRERQLFCLPGLFSWSPLPDVTTGEVTGTFSIITRSANSIMKQIHNGGPNVGRMPLFLPKELERQWLQPELTDQEIQAILHYEMPSEELKYHTVHTIRITAPRPDQLRKTDIYNWTNLPALGNDDPVQQQSLF